MSVHEAHAQVRKSGQLQPACVTHLCSNALLSNCALHLCFTHLLALHLLCGFLHRLHLLLITLPLALHTHCRLLQSGSGQQINGDWLSQQAAAPADNPATPMSSSCQSWQLGHGSAVCLLLEVCFLHRHDKATTWLSCASMYLPPCRPILLTFMLTVQHCLRLARLVLQRLPQLLAQLAALLLKRSHAL